MVNGTLRLGVLDRDHEHRVARAAGGAVSAADPTARSRAEEYSGRARSPEWRRGGGNRQRARGRGDNSHDERREGAIGDRRERGAGYAQRLRKALIVAGVRRRSLHHATPTRLPVDFHSLRRAFCAALAGSGVNAQTSMALGGHSSMVTHQGATITVRKR